jgi:hypothetical protein
VIAGVYGFQRREELHHNRNWMRVATSVAANVGPIIAHVRPKSVIAPHSCARRKAMHSSQQCRMRQWTLSLSLREQSRRSHTSLLICFLALLLIPLQEQAERVCNSPKPQGPPWPGAQDALLTIARGSHDDQRVPSVAVIWQTWSRSNLQPLSSHLMRASRPLHHVQYLASF